MTLSPKPFINADILSPQIQSQIVKFVSFAQPKTKKNHTHTLTHTFKKKKNNDKTFPLCFAANTETFSVTSSY